MLISRIEGSNDDFTQSTYQDNLIISHRWRSSEMLYGHWAIGRDNQIFINT